MTHRIASRDNWCGIMAQEKPNWLAEWLLIARGQLPVVRRRLEEWLATVRDQPTLIWDTVAVRCAVYGLGAVVVLWGAQTAITMLTPPATALAGPEATTADFHVVCSDVECGHHFVVHRKFGFRKFPLECTGCRQKTGTQARRCNSTRCNGRWVAPSKTEESLSCPRCGGHFD